MSSGEHIPTTIPGVADIICPRKPGFRVALGRFSPKSRTGFTLLELAVVIVIIASLACLIVPNLDKTVDDAEITVTKANLRTIEEAINGSAVAPGYFADMKHVPGFDPLDFRIHHLISQLLNPPHNDLLPPYDITTKRGWRGPYLQRFAAVQNTNILNQGLFPAASDRQREGDPTFFDRGFFYDTVNSFYGQPGGDRTIADAWGNPIVLQVPPDDAFTSPTDAKRWYYARLVSAGPDGVLSTPRYDASVPVLQTRRDEARLAGRLSDGTLRARVDDIVLFLNRSDVYEEEL